MKPSISVVTLGVSDFKRSLDFYKNGLGWPTSATKRDKIAFFGLNGTILALYDRGSLAEDAMVSPKGNGFPGVTLAHNTKSEKEVDEIFSQIGKLGVRIVKKPQKAPWGGYSGYFADPDGHLWEVVYNPYWKINQKGNVVLS